MVWAIRNHIMNLKGGDDMSGVQGLAIFHGLLLVILGVGSYLNLGRDS